MQHAFLNVNNHKRSHFFYIYSKQNTLAEWNIIFVISGILYIVPAIIFIAFGTTDVQKWNYAAASSAESNKAIDDVEEIKL